MYRQVGESERFPEFSASPNFLCSFLLKTSMFTIWVANTLELNAFEKKAENYNAWNFKVYDCRLAYVVYGLYL